jgi:DNA-binding NarL/FixJ family response regulator
VSNDEMRIDPQLIRFLADRYPQEEQPTDADALNERDRKVLQEIVSGLSNRKIGEARRV